VAIEASSVPSNSKFHGRLILDPERSLHYRYGAETECMYLIRPDGYVGYRSEPATVSAFSRLYRAHFFKLKLYRDSRFHGE